MKRSCAWKYVTPCAGKKATVIKAQCIYCKKKQADNPTRIKQHLLNCPHVPTDVKEELRKNLRVDQHFTLFQQNENITQWCNLMDSAPGRAFDEGKDIVRKLKFPIGHPYFGLDLLLIASQYVSSKADTPCSLDSDED